MKNAELEREALKLVINYKPSMMCWNGLDILFPIGRT
jgi:hypothetical protein